MNRRLLSLDALRGFDMMFIVGLSAVIRRACACFPGGDQSWLSLQMVHVAWDGFRQHDTIFPLFLFIAGIAFPFSYAKQVSAGASRGKIVAKILRRALILVLLGLVYNKILNLNLASFRFYSVLGRIGISWLFLYFLYRKKVFLKV